jgi:hypothetical protein
LSGAGVIQPGQPEELPPIGNQTESDAAPAGFLLLIERRDHLREEVHAGRRALIDIRRSVLEQEVSLAHLCEQITECSPRCGLEEHRVEPEIFELLRAARKTVPGPQEGQGQRERRRPGGSKGLLGLGESQSQSRLLPVGGRLMDGSGFGGLVERGTDFPVGFARVILLACHEEGKVIFLERVQAGLYAPVVGVPASAVPHAAFG